MNLLDLAERYDSSTSFDTRLTLAEQMRPLLGERYDEFDERYERLIVSASSPAKSVLREMGLAGLACETRRVASVRAGGRQYRLNPPISYGLRNEGGHVSAESEEFRLYADGEDEEEAGREFERHLAALIEGYALEDDVKLSKSGLRLKQRLLARMCPV